MSEGSEPRKFIFRPEVYEVPTLAQAMAITVTPEPGTTTEERWDKETRDLVEDIGSFLTLHPETCVVDYGCGTGRIAKALIDSRGCRVIGVDASQSMRLLSPEYVVSDRFVVWSPDILEKMIARGFRVHACICLWVIQHVFDATEVIERLSRLLAPGGLLYTLNAVNRCVPTDQGYFNDGFDVQAGLRRVFSEENSHHMPAGVTTDHLAATTLIQVLRKRAN